MNANVIEIKFVLYNKKGYELLLRAKSLDIKVTTEYKKNYICLPYNKFLDLFESIKFNTNLIKFYNINDTDLVYFRINNKYRIDYLKMFHVIPTLTKVGHHISISYGVSKVYDGNILNYDIRYGNNMGYFEHNVNEYSFLQLIPSNYNTIKENVNYHKYRVFEIDYCNQLSLLYSS
jgi:hypothetical protein